jgi:hypothetical protein
MTTSPRIVTPFRRGLFAATLIAVPVWVIAAVGVGVGGLDARPSTTRP